MPSSAHQCRAPALTMMHHVLLWSLLLWCTLHFTLVQHIFKLWCSMSYQRFTTLPSLTNPFSSNYPRRCRRCCSMQSSLKLIFHLLHIHIQRWTRQKEGNCQKSPLEPFSGTSLQWPFFPWPAIFTAALNERTMGKIPKGLDAEPPLKEIG